MQHTIDEVEFGQNFYSFNYKVVGYWSDQSVKISVSRKLNVYTNKWYWDFSIIHSTGSRDEEALDDDIQATENFANVVLEAVTFCRELRANANKFENAFQDEISKRGLAKFKSRRTY